MSDVADLTAASGQTQVERPFTARTVTDAWQRGFNATRDERQTALLNQCFMRNKHWNYWNQQTGRLEELPRNADRVRATVAKVGPDSDRIIAKLTARPLVFEVQPRTPEDSSIQAAKCAEAALFELAREDGWEELRFEHAYVAWTAGVGALAVDWDRSQGTVVGVGEDGSEIRTGALELTVVSIHEMVVEPGTRDARKARWWIRGMALPPDTVKETYGLAKKPAADARAVESVYRSERQGTALVPLTMVYTYYERPMAGSPGRMAVIIDDEVVQDGPWPFPFTDRLNIGMCKVKPIHGKWFGDTPVTDAVPVQAAYNASWSSIIEHLKQGGNSRIWIPYGAVDNIEDLSDQAAEAVEYMPVNGVEPKHLGPPSMPDWWIRQPEMLSGAMDNILGQKEVSRGVAPGSIESGLALSILAENDDTMIGRFGRNMADMWGDVASMALKLLEAYVRDTRNVAIKMPGSKIPEVVQWNGQTLQGHTTAYVPTDAIQPRSRSAQLAYAFQLQDRGLINSPEHLAKVADLPDQDDLLAGIDPDSARAVRENAYMMAGVPRTVDVIDDHGNHIMRHRDEMRSQRYEQLPPEAQEIFRQHVAAHEMYAAQAAAAQAQAAGISPLAAMLPSEQPQVLSPEALAAASIQGLAPAAGTEPPLEPEMAPTDATE